MKDIFGLQKTMVLAAEINSFLAGGYNEPGEFLVEPPDDDLKAAIDQSAVVEISITDRTEFSTAMEDGEECQRLLSIFLPKEVLFRALRRELDGMKAELKTIGFDCDKDTNRRILKAEF
jgi:hypothetical protein